MVPKQRTRLVATAHFSAQMQRRVCKNMPQMLITFKEEVIKFIRAVKENVFKT